MLFSLILACTNEGGIGINNSIPWTIRDEMLLFKRITSYANGSNDKKNAVIMGRKTWESLPYKPLKNRINIIITSNPSLINTNDVFVFKSFDEGLEFCDINTNINKVFVIGGKSLYDLCLDNEKYLNKIESIHLSIIKEKFKCDTHINLKKIIKTFNKYNINDVIFNSNFIHIKYLANSNN